MSCFETAGKLDLGMQRAVWDARRQRGPTGTGSATTRGG